MQFAADRALAGDHRRIVKWMYESQSLFLFELPGARMCIVIGVAVQDNLATECTHCIDFDCRCGNRHDDDSPDVSFLRRKRNALGMITG